jgi:hypothetical protein
MLEFGTCPVANLVVGSMVTLVSETKRCTPSGTFLKELFDDIHDDQPRVAFPRPDSSATHGACGVMTAPSPVISFFLAVGRLLAIYCWRQPLRLLLHSI